MEFSIRDLVSSSQIRRFQIENLRPPGNGCLCNNPLPDGFSHPGGLPSTGIGRYLAKECAEKASNSSSH